jgi:prefoldin subunit 5
MPARKKTQPIVAPAVVDTKQREIDILRMELEQLQRRHANLYTAFRALNKTKNELLDILMGIPAEKPSNEIV